MGWIFEQKKFRNFEEMTIEEIKTELEMLRNREPKLYGYKIDDLIMFKHLLDKSNITVSDLTNAKELIRKVLHIQEETMKMAFSNVAQTFNEKLEKTLKEEK